jgi:hypothetical protein
MANPNSYQGEGMLVGANELCIEIKEFIEIDLNNSLYRETLQEYLEMVEDYIRDIEDYDFAPRTDRLTKEGILIDLENTKVRINGLLSNGGRRRKSRKFRKSRKGRSRKTYRNGRSRKAYRRSRK